MIKNPTIPPAPLTSMTNKERFEATTLAAKEKFASNQWVFDAPPIPASKKRKVPRSQSPAYRIARSFKSGHGRLS